MRTHGNGRACFMGERLATGTCDPCREYWRNYEPHRRANAKWYRRNELVYRARKREEKQRAEAYS